MKVSEIRRTLQNQFSGFVPEFFKMMRSGYRKADFTKDLMSGTIVGIVALPLAVAFAIASGVGPEKGLYTAIIAGFLISFLGGSRFQIGGPTGAFVVIVFGIVSEYGYDGLATATLMAGVMLVIFGFLKLGGIIKFIPFPVTVGFTMGIAIIIALGQIPNFLGFVFPDGVKEPAGALEKIWFYGKFLNTVNPFAVLVGVAAFLICLFWPKWNAKIPGSLVAILVTTLLVKLFHLDSVYGVATIGSEYQIPVGIPKPAMPQISLELMRKLFQPAISIALLGAIESLLSAVVADGMTGKKHSSNTELVAQGFANIFSPVFGGIPATGAIARTATNVRNGAVSPVSGMVHAAILLLIMLFFGKYAEMIPLPTLAAVLFIVAFNMSDYKMFFKIFKSPKSDVIVLVSTFLLTILIDLTVAIQVGVLTAAVLFIKRMSEVSGIESVTNVIRDEDDKGADFHNLSAKEVPPGVVVYEIAGSLFFGAVDKFRMTLERIEGHPKILILRMRRILSMDAAGIKMIEDLLSQCRRNGTGLILSGVHAQPVLALKRSGVLAELGEENVLGNIDASLNRAREILGIPLVEIEEAEFVPSVSWERHREKPWLPENVNGIVAEESPEVIVENVTAKFSAAKCGDEENRDAPK